MVWRKYSLVNFDRFDQKITKLIVWGHITKASVSIINKLD